MEVSVRLAAIDVTADCLDVSTISRGTGYPYAAVTQPSSAQVTLSDAAGQFAPENTDNFWTVHGANQNAMRAPVEIRADAQLVFRGEVIELTQNIPQATVVVKCTDLSRKLRTEKITDFGVEKAWRLIKRSGEAVGVYPLVAGTAPLSEGSVTVHRAMDAALTIVSKVKTTGVLDPTHVEVSETAVISEGQWIAAASATYPRIAAKTPYRYKHVRGMVNAILDYFAYPAGADNRYIESLLKPVPPYGAALGRIGYETVLGSIGVGVPLDWNGVVTDMLSDAGDVYVAYSVNAGTPKFSMILKYDISEDAWSVLRTVPQVSLEIWGLAKIGNQLIMLVTDGDYDSARSNLGKLPPFQYDFLGPNQTKLIYMDVTEESPVIQTLVPSDSVYPPQIATLLQTGSHAMHIPEGQTYQPLPDTRRRLRVSGGMLYYPYAVMGSDEVITAGVARIDISAASPEPVSVLAFESDNYNHAGFAFDFDGEHLVLGTTFIDDCNQSRLKIVKQT